MKRRNVYALFAIKALLVSQVTMGQVKISEMVQYSKAAHSNENALYLVDFWATWCGPCHHVKKYLGSLQRQYPDKFYIVSISEENPDKVKRFLQKNPTNLAVAIDYDGETFAKHGVRALPHAVLLNANGNVLWEGASADFKTYHIEKFLRQQRKTIDVSEMFTIKEQQLVSSSASSFIPTEDLELQLLNNTLETDLEVSEANGYLKLTGSLQNILSYASKVYKAQIQIPKDLNKTYKLYVKKDSEAYNNVADSVMDALGLEFSRNQSTGEALVLTIENPTFWDTTQINWGNGSPAFLVGDSEVKADNVTLFEVANTLASAIEMPVVIEPFDFEDNTKHDWQIHYKFFDLMKNELQDSYGIKADKKQASYAVFNVTKKAP